MKKLLIVISILILILIVGVIALMTVTKPTTPPVAKSVPTKTVTPKVTLKPAPPSPKATLTLTPSTSVVSSDKQFTVTVGLNTTTDVYAVDLAMQYDTEAFSLVTIGPGDYFTSVQEFKKTINQNTGNILYTTGALKPATGNRTLATLTFQAKTGKNKGSIMVINKTLVATNDALPANVTLPTALTVQIVNTAP